MSNYDWVTPEIFERKLHEIVTRMSSDELLVIPGVYEALSEELNNQILEELEEEREI